MAAQEFEPMDDGFQERLRNYFAVAWRRKYLFLVPTICGAALTIVVVLALPQIYRSAATILVEAQQVPETIIQAGPSSYVNERIESIRQRILTQGNLLAVADKFRLYGEDGAVASSDIEAAMREAIDIENVSVASERNRQTPSTIAVTLSFENKDPQVAQDVTNELATRFLNLNARSRSTTVNDTTAFISGEAARLNAQVMELEAAIAAYRKQHHDLLPERAELYARRIEELEDAQRELDTSMRALQVNRISVASQLAAFTKKKTGDDVLVTELRETRSKLRDARSRYTDAHPQVRRLQHRLDDLEASLAARTPEELLSQQDSEQEADPLYVQLQYELNGMDAQVKLLTEQKTAVQREAQKLRQLSGQIPTVNKDLAALQRQYEDAKLRFQELTSKEMQAQLSEKLESEQMAERFSLIEPPTLPDKPVKPNRKLLAAAGVGLSMALSAALVVLVELLDTGIRRRRQLRPYFSDKVPIITVPYVADARDKMLAASKAASVLLIVAAAVFAAGLSVHMRYQPLDTFWQSAAQQHESKADTVTAR